MVMYERWDFAVFNGRIFERGRSARAYGSGSFGGKKYPKAALAGGYAV
ncbi:MAG: hypothetical protein RR540_08955 [Oscillospiraceae bacterium]